MNIAKLNSKKPCPKNNLSEMRDSKTMSLFPQNLEIICLSLFGYARKFLINSFRGYEPYIKYKKMHLKVNTSNLISVFYVFHSYLSLHFDIISAFK